MAEKVAGTGSGGTIENQLMVANLELAGDDQGVENRKEEIPMDRINDEEGGAAGEEEEEFDFDPSEHAQAEGPRWFAMARFYSSHSMRGLFDEMGVAWRLVEPIPVRKLEDNRFILEFPSEETLNFVINGGPWRHKGDALIVVAYDGVSRPSEVQFYDVPATLMSHAFTEVLAKKVSRKVLEVWGPIKNFLRARVAFPLDEPIKPVVEAKVKEFGAMLFDVRYENVPYFFFQCGRLGHAKRECPEEEEDDEEEADGELNPEEEILKRR
ncbi:hypothetical protein C2845_PM01G25630 [Panicum miliaceum]|uniref:CCHC-type domain-containing protein n=1 Tax=Panicum miliaceum TaxID=4540 RepID=A0A3L6TLR8_PANMI|nr:hypothetical protein C2845_PM01G25630 [Panicum miliaceum]